MKNHTDSTDDLSRVRYELELFLLGGDFDLYEDGRLISSTSPGRCAAEFSYGKLIFSCWGEGWSRSWRITGCEVASEHLRLHCTKQMGLVRCTVELRHGPVAFESARSREDFTVSLSAIIESNLAGFRVESATSARNDSSHLSGVHTRLVLSYRGKLIAGIGISGQESDSNINATLAYAVIWLEALRRKQSRVNRLMIFVPRGHAITIATRMTRLRSDFADISLYEVDETSKTLEPVAAFDQGDVADNLRKAARRARWPRVLQSDPELSALVDSIAGLAPDLIEIQMQHGSIKLSIHGLDFARVSTARRRVEFGSGVGSGGGKKILDQTNRRELEELIFEIASRRSADSEHRNDQIFRAQGEQWLESIIRRDITILDATLDPRFVYSQVPAYRGEQRAFIDLLASTRDGRLVVIELKVSEDVEFPFQGLDYWLRVQWHLKRKDFQKRGYFAGLRLSDARPMIYLVAPLFRFHATTKLIAQTIQDHVPVYRLGINENWRAGVKVLLHERLN